MKAAEAVALEGEPTPAAYEGRHLRQYVDATRPPFLTVSVVAVLLGLSGAWFDGVTIQWWVFLLAGLGAVLAQAAANVLNDYYDALNGTDAANTQRVFPFTGGSRFIQNGVLTERQTALLGVALMAATAGIGVLLLGQGGWPLLALGLAGLLLAWAYSAPPLALNSRGLGEPVVAVGFGLIIPLGMDLVLRGAPALLPLQLGASYALLVAAILYMNQFPDLEADRIAGKHHWVVRLGAARGRWIYPLLALAAHGWLAAAVWLGLLPAWALLALLSLPASLAASVILWRHAAEPPALVPAIRLTLVAAMGHGLLLGLGLWLARAFA
jgi:1,4-dihydroxy-2-naphthoate polyprenyltransferase